MLTRQGRAKGLRRTGNGGFDAGAAVDCDGDSVRASHRQSCRPAGRQSTRRSNRHGLTRRLTHCNKPALVRLVHI